MSDKTPIVRVYNKVFDHIPVIEELAECEYMKFVKEKDGQLVLHYDAIEITGYERICASGFHDTPDVSTLVKISSLNLVHR